MDEPRSCLIFSQHQMTTFLCNILHRCIYEGIHHYWNFAKKNPHPTTGVYGAFRAKLELIPSWNTEVITQEYKRIIHKSKCPYLEQLIRKVFIYNTQILAAAEPIERSVRVPVPRGDRFIHRVYITTARSMFENFWIMEDRPERVSAVEQAKNLTKAYRSINQCIENTILEMLPIGELVSRQVEDNYDPFADQRMHEKQNQVEKLRNIDSLFSHSGSVHDQEAPATTPYEMERVLYEESEPSLPQEPETPEKEETKSVSSDSTTSSNTASSMNDAVKVIYMGHHDEEDDVPTLNPQITVQEEEQPEVIHEESDASSEATETNLTKVQVMSGEIDSSKVDLPNQSDDFNPAKEPVAESVVPAGYYENMMGLINRANKTTNEDSPAPPPSESNFFDDAKTTLGPY